MWNKKEKIQLIFLVFSSCMLLGSMFPWDYANSNNNGVEKYFSKDYSKAEELFRKGKIENEKSLDIKYNLGNSLYKQDNYAESFIIFSEILEVKDLPKDLEQKTHYNLGNSYYKLGEEVSNTTYWIKALQEYEAALKLDSSDRQARDNYEFVKNKLKDSNKNNQSKKQNKKNNNSQQSYKNNSSSNNNSSQEQDKTVNITKSEMEHILKELQKEEQTMQEYIDRKSQSNQNTNTTNNLDKKDW